jgi:hypothetical protein
MQVLSWQRKRMTGRSQTRRTPAGRPAPRFRPRLEVLERRDVLSTLTVTNNLDGPAGSVRAEVAAAQPGDTIVFAPSLDGQTITLAGQLEINKNLTIQGPGAGLLAISGNDAAFGALVNSRLFQVDANVRVTLTGLTLEDGGGLAYPLYNNTGYSDQTWDGYGGAILNFGILTVSGCTLSDNSVGSDGIGPVYHGGAIYNAGTLTVSNSTLSGNYAGDPYVVPQGASFGGGIDNVGTLTVSNSTLSGNSATYGGGIRNTGTVTVNSSTVTGNSAQYGGGIYNDGTLAIDYSTVLKNTATSKGGDLYNLGTYTAVGSKIGHIAK